MQNSKLILVLLVLFSTTLKADEGMWLPQLLKQLNETDMQKRGLKLSSDEIYSINKTSLKDAVLLFGGGCTGEMISEQGLLLTNYHCGYSSIQVHSTVSHDYLTQGFWAKNRNEELPCPNLTAMFIIKIENVTDQIISQLDDGMSETERENRIKSISGLLEKKAIEGTHYEAFTKPFFYGNEFYLFVAETFKDVRLVGAPPSSIGKFGFETDNWIWPRQTGDFALFRIYAGANNKPAAFSKDNKPFVPRYHFKINLSGIAEGDFTMVYGFPGKTSEYLTSYGIALTYETSNPAKIKIRESKLKLMHEGMLLADSIRIAYAAKYASTSNYYKKWQGEQSGLKQNNAIFKKKEEEKLFTGWVLEDAVRKKKYVDLLPSFESTYKAMKPWVKTNDYLTEALFGIELVNFAANFNKVVLLCETDTIDNVKLAAACKYITSSDGFFKNFHLPTDKNICKSMLKLYQQDIEKEMQPEIFSFIEKKYKGSIEAYTDDLYLKTWFLDKKKVKELLVDFKATDVKKIKSDPAFLLFNSISQLQRRITDSLSLYNVSILRLQRLYMTAIKQMQTERKFYPDANLTLRISYGNVKGFEPRDGLIYKYYTTLDGVMQKADTTNPEFYIPEKLTELFKNKDYGRYGRDKKMPVAFIATNHTTNGNSGSPVLNSKGELIGTNFDRVWEGTMSDLMYDQDICRNIVLDIRYTLFIVDKFAGAGYLIDEMTIVE